MTRSTSSTSAPPTMSEERKLDTSGTPPTGRTSGPTYDGARDYARKVFGPQVAEVWWLELLWWRVLHLFGQHTAIESHNIELDEFNTVKRIERRVECAVCEVVM